VWAALLGILVSQSISNGMDLLSLASSVKFTIDASRTPRPRGCRRLTRPQVAHPGHRYMPEWVFVPGRGKLRG